MGASGVGAAALGAGAMGAGTSALGGIMQGKSAADILKNSLISGTVGAATAGALGGTGGAESQYVGDMPTDAMGSLPPQAPVSGIDQDIAREATLGQNIETPQSIVDNMKPNILSGGPQNLDGTAYTPPTAADTVKDAMSKPYDYTKASTLQKFAPGMASNIAGSMFQPGNGINPVAGQGVPKGLQFHFNEDPNAMYQPAVAPNYNGIAGIDNGPRAQRPIGYGYANGGTVEQMSRENAIGGNQAFPQSGLGGLTGMNTYQNATNTPTGTDVIEPTDAVTNPYTGAMKFAAGGGIASYAKGGDLGSYSDGGRMLKGPGDGMSDSIPAKIGHRQPARLADSEFVIPADVVSHLGNGSSDAGAKQLYAMMDRVRKARTGRKAQGKQIKPQKYLPV
jgi:hypothetical protein